jgi:DNA processing protein
MDELSAWLVLARAPHLHAAILTPLLSRFDSVVTLVKSTPAELHAAEARPALIDYLQRAAPPDAERRWLDRDRHHFIAWPSSDYPPLLRELPDAPIGLFVRGDPTLLTMPQLAMVGSRNPTPGGRDNARSFATHLGQCGITVTSGLALGIDTASHEGAIQTSGRTIAVCGTGLDIAYPRSNLRLAEAIAEQGALVSEFALGCPPLKANFPRRNRIIGGLSLGTLVVEAALQSGSLITARLAADAGREVFAIPGSIHNPMARGCHALIRQGAKLVETAADIFSELGSLAGSLRLVESSKASEILQDSAPQLDNDYKILLDALGFEPAGVDLLVMRTGLRADEVASMLLLLEMEGRIASYPGGLYVRTRPEGTK